MRSAEVDVREKTRETWPLRAAGGGHADERRC